MTRRVDPYPDIDTPSCGGATLRVGRMCVADASLSKANPLTLIVPEKAMTTRTVFQCEEVVPHAGMHHLCLVEAPREPLDGGVHTAWEFFPLIGVLLAAQVIMLLRQRRVFRDLNRRLRMAP